MPASGFFLPYHILSLLLLGQLASCQVDILISVSQPRTAFHVSQSFVSFSIEADRWLDWVGTISSPNDFFLNTLDNLQQLTGIPPQIRIGANTADNTLFGGNVSTVLLTSGVKSLANLQASGHNYFSKCEHRNSIPRGQECHR